MNLSSRIGALEDQTPRLSDIVIVNTPHEFCVYQLEQELGETEEQFSARVDAIKRAHGLNSSENEKQS